MFPIYVHIVLYMFLFVPICLHIFSYIGYQNTGSPVLFRLTLAFFAIGIGFGIIWSGYMIDLVYLEVGEINRGIQALGLGVQTIGYFFIAFSHTIKSFFPKSRYFRSVGVLPLFFLSTIFLLEFIFDLVLVLISLFVNS